MSIVINFDHPDRHPEGQDGSRLSADHIHLQCAKVKVTSLQADRIHLRWAKVYFPSPHADRIHLRWAKVFVTRLHAYTCHRQKSLT